MSISSKIYNAVQDNNSKKFAELLDSYAPEHHSFSYVITNIFQYEPLRHCVIPIKTGKEFEALRTHAKNTQKKTIQRFCGMLEQWLKQQTPELSAKILTCDHYNFHIRFLQNVRDPVPILNFCDAQCYLTMNDQHYDKDYGDKSIVIDCKPLTEMLDAKLGSCVDAIVSQNSVQRMLAGKVMGLDAFFKTLLKPKNTVHALHYLECMQQHFTPHWVGVFLNALLATKNTHVGQWLANNSHFAQFLTTSHFATVGAQISVWAPRAYKDVLMYEEFFPPTLWNAVVQNTTLACVGGKYFSKWVEYIQRSQFDGQRVKMVQRYLERHFTHNQDVYKYGQYHVDDSYFKKNVAPALDILTCADVVAWKNTQWFLNAVYRVDEHNSFLRHRIEQAIENPGCETARKI